MKRNVELLAPGGDIDSIKAAIAAGADAIYCGLNRFNARNRAANIILEDLNGILGLAHENNCKIFLTLNIVVLESEIPAFVRLLNQLINTSIDGVIVQDLGMLYLLSNYFSGLKIHASTQLTTHNAGQIKFLRKLNVSRVNFSRELSIDEVKGLTAICHENNILTEVFVQGSYCISFSGLCYMSSVFAGKSGNRGRCSQPCRDRYVTTPEGNNYPLNLKDNSAYFALDELVKAQVDSIKIEGRIKASDYVYTVVNCWKKQIDNFYNHGRMASDNSDLYKVFNRDFSDGFLRGNISRDIFIDNPMDNSIKQFARINKTSKNKELLKEKEEYYGNKEKISSVVKNKIKQLSVAKKLLQIVVSGELDAPLKITVKGLDDSFVVLSTMNLVAAGTYSPKQHSQSKRKVEDPVETGNDNLASENWQRKAEHLSYENLFDRLKGINTTEYCIDNLGLENLQKGLFLPFKELTLIKKKIVSILNGSREVVDPVEVPIIETTHAATAEPTLAVLISSKDDLHLCERSSADIFFQLPNSFGSQCRKYVDLFFAHKELLPWFPAILIGEDYTAAVEFLHNVQPKLIVTNNTGIAYEAFSKGIPWLAGPYLNIANSFSLLCLKEKFNCCGSFLSNEINESQLKNIRTPAGFKLYYSIYHPILLITSRQCLFHQVVGCEKNSIDEQCIEECSKSSSITRINEVPLFIEKTKGNYHCIYNNTNFLNTSVMSDMPDKFSGFLVDLRDVKTKTNSHLDKGKIITLFENLLNADLDSAKELSKNIFPTTQAQYTKGI